MKKCLAFFIGSSHILRVSHSYNNAKMTLDFKMFMLVQLAN